MDEFNGIDLNLIGFAVLFDKEQELIGLLKNAPQLNDCPNGLLMDMKYRSPEKYSLLGLINKSGAIKCLNALSEIVVPNKNYRYAKEIVLIRGVQLKC